MPRQFRRSSPLAVGSVALLSLLTAAAFANSEQEPSISDDGVKAPRAVGALPDMSLMLEPVINGRPGQNVLAVDYKDGHYYISASELSRLGLPVDASSTEKIAVDEIKDVTVTYEGESQKLFISVPTEWLPEQRLSASRLSSAAAAENPLGLLLNYDIYASHSSDDSSPDAVSAYTEQRVLGLFGSLSNSGVYNQHINGESEDENNHRYLRYDTVWRYDDEPRMLKYLVGDAITGSLPWSSSVRLGGVQISRNFSARPDLITYPLPQFAGQAAVPSSVDVYLNNYKYTSANVNPGPFTVETVPYINGAGNATVVVTDPLGRQVNTVVPFYVSSSLLKPGLTDFSLSAGKIRNNYGIKNADYGANAASGIGRAGLTSWMTLEARAESAEKLNVGGLGAVIKVGNLGVVNGAYGISRSRPGAFSASESEMDDASQSSFYSSKQTGRQRSLGYAYTQNYFSVNAQQIDRSDGYGDLSNYQSGYRLDKRSRQLTGSVSLQRFGSVGVGYFDVTQYDDSRLRLLNVSYSTTLFSNNSLYASMNREIGSSGYSAQITISIPFNAMGSATVTSSRDTENRWSHQATYSKAAPTDGGLGWTLSYAKRPNDQSDYKQANLDYAANAYRLQGGIYGDRDETYWGEISGSLVAVKGNLFASKTINDAFALVSTNGYAGVPVRYENQPLGKTDDDGYLLIPSVTAYAEGKYEIDPMGLPVDVQIPTVEQHRAVKGSGGTVIEFPLRKVVAVTLTLVDENRTPLPRGSLVRQEGQEDIAYVGWDGETYLGNAAADNALRVTRADDGRQCRASFALPAPIPSGWTPGELICKESLSHD
ncbi:outer membrane usher protein [Leminorella grimontii]|uniref:Outer membrane usher protein n=1 Tax=Leminorella grimontii TaxID=82981 RepID=A0AAV5MVT3_9GAMM|nr:fimbria/pilus outer membrane usher protein [Leminorella grimontii]GKX53946.1 outer membrane usher protein [Leminorella grimontii]VFS60508.1 Outer membrane usher protein fimD precursor [Leminorella grimontii]